MSLSLIREAIAMVATGIKPRVVVASLRFGDGASAPGADHRSRVWGASDRIWTLERHVHSIAIEADGDGNG